MADAYDVTYEAVLDAIIAAVGTAWTLDETQIYVGEPEVQPSSAPFAHIHTPRVSGRNMTPVSDEYTLEWVISLAFERVADEMTDVTRAKKYAALQAELYGALNLGDYAYKGQLLGYEVADTNIEDAIGVACTFTCEIEVAAARG